jgi:carboxymethylenebutenolidase
VKVTIPVSGVADLDGELAVPAEGGPWPGVVVVHDAFGMTDDIGRIARRFASAGYLALVPALYSRRAPGALAGFRCVRSVFGDLVRGRGRALEDLDAARAFLTARDDSTGRTGIAGFCLGGGFALLAAGRGFDASAPYYGQLPRDPALLDGACPVVASFGGRDRSLRGAAGKLDRLLTERDVPHDIKEYPDAGHSFANRNKPRPVLSPLMRLAIGAEFNESADSDAWQRVHGFFAAHLRGPAGPAEGTPATG